MNTDLVQKIALIALSHHHFDVDEIGRFHICEERLGEVLSRVKKECGLDELMYLSTCNRVEFILVTDSEITHGFMDRFFTALLGEQRTEEVANAVTKAKIFYGENVLRHTCEVAASLD